MLAVGLTRVVLPLVRLHQFPLQELVVVCLGVDLLVGGFPGDDGHRLVRRFDGCGVPIGRSLLPRSSNGQPGFELICPGHCRRIAHCRGVAVEGVYQVFLVAEFVPGVRDFHSRFVDESTCQPCSISLFSADIDVDGFIGKAILNAIIICNNIP